MKEEMKNNPFRGMIISFTVDDLIEKLLNENPEQRLSWEEYFNHPFLKKDNEEKYVIIGKPKDGGYGTIFQAKNKKNNELIAIKKFDKNQIIKQFLHDNFKPPSEEEMNVYIDRFYNEVKCMILLEGKDKKNENAVKVYEYFNNKDDFTIYMELCDCNLLNLLSEKKESFTSDEIYNILTQLNNSFKIMRDNNLVNRDLSFDNILIKYKNEEKTQYIVKLKLNQYCCSIDNLSDSNLNYRGQKIIPPEVLKEGIYKENSDLWNLGIIIYILLFRKNPYKNENEISLISQKDNFEHKNLEKTNNSNLDDLIDKLLIVDPKKRLSWDQYFLHPFFQKDNDITILKDDYKKYYILEEQIGMGAFGVVHKAKKIDTNEKRAIKIFEKEKIRTNIRNEFFREPSEEEMKSYTNSLINEIINMKIVQSKNKESENNNTVKFYECYNSKNEFVIVMELCDTNLLNIFIKRDKPYNIEEIKGILFQLNNSFKIMVENKLVHRDLKLQNILVKYDNKSYIILKLTDYGLSKKLLSLSKKFSTFVGTINFMAPEILKNEKYDWECDLWSLGVIIYVLCFKNYPYKGENERDVLKQIKEFNNKAKTGNKDLDDLISKLLIEDPKERITWKDYFAHPFFSNSIKPILIEEQIIENQNEYKKEVTETTETIYKNFILLKIKIKEENINKDIYFLEKDNEGHKHLKDLNESNCILYINNIEQKKFTNYFKTKISGEYDIKIIFLKNINNCSYMFNKCVNIIYIDLSYFDSSKISDMNHMFSECYNLKNINLSNLNTENVKDMSYMFNKCYELEKLDFPKSFNTENVNNISFMFHNCQNISQIYFSSSFKTNNVINMRTFFGKCYCLTKLDLRNFNTEKVKDMSNMFENCKNLESLNLSTFTTNNVTHMSYMFSGCVSLKSLDLSSFNAENAKFMSYMFYRCKDLNDINLSKCINNENTNMIFMFSECYNLKSINISSFIITDNNKIDNMFDNLTNIKEIIINKRYIEKYKKLFKNHKYKFIFK